MNKTMQLLKNEEGSVMVVVIIMMALLLLMGITATNISTVEMQILRNSIIQKQDFYKTEGGLSEVAADVGYSGLSGRSCPDNTVRSSCSANYTIKDVDTPVILTTAAGSGTANPTAGQIENVKDTTWPINHEDSETEYAYRVFYKGQGPIPKGEGAGFGSYVFDITVRKQSGATEAEMSTTINEGFRKIGPKG